MVRKRSGSVTRPCRVMVSGRVRLPNRRSERRAEKLLAVQQEISLRHNRELVGTEQTVIIDRITGKGTAEGRTLLDAPDIDNIVRVRFKGRLAAGEVAAVRIDRAGEYELNGTLIRKEGA